MYCTQSVEEGGRRGGKGERKGWEEGEGGRKEREGGREGGRKERKRHLSLHQVILCVRVHKSASSILSPGLTPSPLSSSQVFSTPGTMRYGQRQDGANSSLFMNTGTPFSLTAKTDLSPRTSRKPTSSSGAM